MYMVACLLHGCQNHLRREGARAARRGDTADMAQAARASGRGRRRADGGTLTSRVQSPRRFAVLLIHLHQVDKLSRSLFLRSVNA